MPRVLVVAATIMVRGEGIGVSGVGWEDIEILRVGRSGVDLYDRSTAWWRGFLSGPVAKLRWDLFIFQV